MISEASLKVLLPLVFVFSHIQSLFSGGFVQEDQESQVRATCRLILSPFTAPILISILIIWGLNFALRLHTVMHINSLYYKSMCKSLITYKLTNFARCNYYEPLLNRKLVLAKLKSGFIPLLSGLCAMWNKESLVWALRQAPTACTAYNRWCVYCVKLTGFSAH